MKKSSGIVFAILGILCSALAWYFYSQVSSSYYLVTPLTLGALGCLAVFVLLSLVAGGKSLWTLLIGAASVLLMAAFAVSLVTEVEVLGYLLSGLRTWADVQSWAYFSIAALLGWLILLIGSFTKLGVQ